MEPDSLRLGTSRYERRLPPSLAPHVISRPFSNYRPNKRPVERATQVLEGEQRRRMSTSEDAIRPPLLVARPFCAFHQVYGHSTQSCNRLAEEIEHVVQHQVNSGEQREELSLPRPLSRRSRCPPERERQVNNQRRVVAPHRSHGPPQWNQNGRRGAPSINLPNRRVINMISRGSTSGDSNRARKAYNHHLKSYTLRTNHKTKEVPVISFGSVDLEGVITPHEDALVIRATIANYDAAKVFVDSRSYGLFFSRKSLIRCRSIHLSFILCLLRCLVLQIMKYAL